MRAAAFIAALLWSAAGEAQWAATDRMHELQAIMANPESTSAQREAARKELSDLLKSPAGQARPTPDEKPVHPPRAAIEPFGRIVKPPVNPPISAPGVATMDVVVPPRLIISAPTGRPIAPSIGAAVDPRSGHILHETPSGYIDPRTGQFVPK